MTHPARLAELVRLLEARRHVFARDPLLVTQQLMDSDLPLRERLMERARRIDAEGTLAARIDQIDRRIQGVIRVAMGFWALLGFLATCALMQAAALNFFAVLLAILGLHTLMLLVWLLLLARRRTHTPALPQLVLSRLPSDEVSQALAELYRQELLSPRAFWHWSRIGHQLWLCSLLGMLAAVVGMLGIRQYTFGWQSTLLGSATLTQVVQVLGWLPAQLGFAVPSAQAVAMSELHGATSVARDWAGLLLGSVLCYGLMPRALVWLGCWWAERRGGAGHLDVSLPTYQAIAARWTPVVVDSAADYRADVVRRGAHPGDPLRVQPGLARLAVLLDSPDVHPHWAQQVEGDEWPHWGSVEAREDLTHLLGELAARPTALLVGIELRGQTVPDRGLLRRLEQLAAACAGPLTVALLLGEGLTAKDMAPERLSPWQSALTARGMALIVIQTEQKNP